MPNAANSAIGIRAHGPQLGAWISIVAGVLLCAALAVTLPTRLVLYSVVGLSIWALIVAFLQARTALVWCTAGAGCVAAALAARVLWIAPGPEFGPRLLVEIVLLMAPTVLILALLGRTVSGWFDRALADREQFLVLLNEIAQAALQASSGMDLVQATGPALVQLFAADGGILILRDRHADQPGTTACFGAMEQALARLAFQPDDPLIDEVVLEPGRVLAASQAESAPYLGPRLARAAAGRPLLTLPLIAARQRLGAAILFLPYGRSASPQVIARAEQVARQIARAANEVQLREELARHARRLDAALHVKETMLREIHHRVKNNLQVVSSLLSLQTGSQTGAMPTHVLRDSQSRIRSIALVHEKLYRSPDIDQVDVADYIRGLVTFLFRTYTVRVGSVDLDLDVEDLTFSMDTAVPFGLIVNELVSNALKYAFPADRQRANGDRNKLFIGVYKRHDRFELLVRDNGVGLPGDLDFRNTDSLGLQLVNTLAEQLEGTVEVERCHGTTFRLDLALIDSHEHLASGPQ